MFLKTKEGMKNFLSSGFGFLAKCPYCGNLLKNKRFIKCSGRDIPPNRYICKECFKEFDIEVVYREV